MRLTLGFMGESEGAGDKGESYDLRLYVAVLVVCRVCILNLPGHVGKQAFLSRVAALAAAAKSLEFGEGGKRRRGAGPADPPFGHLHVVCRNYQLTGGATGEYEVSFRRHGGTLYRSSDVPSCTTEGDAAAAQFPEVSAPRMRDVGVGLQICLEKKDDVFHPLIMVGTSRTMHCE
jgi:hypothetical protein